MGFGRLGASGGGGGLSGAVVVAFLKRSIAWYDFDPLTGVAFQEAAASTPAATVGDPLGAWLDRFRRDVPATQATAGFRPLLGRTVKGGRRNLFLDTENHAATTWVKTTTTVSDDGATAPSGAVAYKIYADASPPLLSKQLIISAAQVTYSFYIKKGSGATQANRYIAKDNTTGDILIQWRINFDTGVITYDPVTMTQQAGLTVEALGSGAYYVRHTITTVPGRQYRFFLGFMGGSTSIGEYSYLGEVQVEEGGEATPYQAIGATVADVTEIGKDTLWYASFDQIDDALAVPVPDLGTDAVVAYADENGVTILEGQTISTSYPLITSAQLFALAIYDDPLTSAEKNAIRSIMNPLTEAL